MLLSIILRFIDFVVLPKSKKNKREFAKLHPEIDTNLVIHGFRHSAATCIVNNSTAAKAQQILHHKNISTTSDYIHVEINPEIMEMRSKILRGE